MAEIQLSDVFVEMADTLVDDFDVLEFLHVLTERCVQLLGVSAAGLLLTDQQGTLQVVAASSERTRLLVSSERLLVLVRDRARRVSAADAGKARRSEA